MQFHFEAIQKQCLVGQTGQGVIEAALFALVFDPFALGDVKDQQFDRRPPKVVDPHAIGLDLEAAPIEAQKTHLPRGNTGPLFALQQFRHPRLGQRAVVGVDVIKQRAQIQLIDARGAKELQRPGIGVEQFSSVVQHVGEGHHLDECTKDAVAGAQRFTGAQAHQVGVVKERSQRRCRGLHLGGVQIAPL